MSLYTKAIKPILFSQDPERMHHLFNVLGRGIGSNVFSLSLLELMINPIEDKVLKTDFLGLELNNPIGLGAGFDKEGAIVPVLGNIGFGFAEVGTVTGQMSPGNKGIRLWRLPEDEALVVNYGLVSSGVAVVKKRFEKYRKDNKWRIPVGISVAKSNVVGLSGSAGLDDIAFAYSQMEEYADYVTINVSCPNVGDACQYCEDSFLYQDLLKRIDQKNPQKPVLVKLSPDLSEFRLNSILEDSNKYSWLKGFILTNLTHDRSGLVSPNLVKATSGGVSGIGLRSKSDKVLEFMAKRGQNRYVFVGLGGVRDAQDVYRKIRLGAGVVQIVTSLIYNGPFLVKKMNQELARMLKKDGFKNVKEAVGVDL